MFSPKIEIINYFDELINQVDINIEESLEQYNEHQVLSELKCFGFEKKILNVEIRRFVSLNKSSENTNSEYQTVELWSESTKVVDYLNQVRMRTIDELKKAQEESLEYYKLNSDRFTKLKEMSNGNKLDELKSQLFAERFYFQVRIKRESKPWVFNLFTFVTDFYMSPSDIHILEMFINSDDHEIFFDESKPVFDEKMVLICLLPEYLMGNLINLNYPNHVISVRKRDIENIKKIDFPNYVREVKLTCSSMDFSKLESLTLSQIADSIEFELDGLSSLEYLELSLKSVERISLRNLPALKHLVWSSNKLNLNINLDDLVNLETLKISSEIGDEFNFGLFKKICNHLQELSISLPNISNEHIVELFYGLNFPNLKNLKIEKSQVTQLEKRMFEGFPMLQYLTITDNKNLLEIESDAFSSLTNLVKLNLHSTSIETINQKHFSQLVKLNYISLYKNRIGYIEGNAFSNLTNLTKLDLGGNRLRELNPNSFIGLGNLKSLDLMDNGLVKFDLSILDYIPNIKEINLILNSITNKKEIEERVKYSKAYLDLRKFKNNSTSDVRISTRYQSMIDQARKRNIGFFKF